MKTINRILTIILIILLGVLVFNIAKINTEVEKKIDDMNRTEIIKQTAKMNSEINADSIK